MSHESTPVMRERGLLKKPRETRRKDGITREEFDLLVESRDGKIQYAARLVPEFGGGWNCFVSINDEARTGRGNSPSSAFNDAAAGRMRQARGAWICTITDEDGDAHQGSDSTPALSIDAAYAEFMRERGRGHKPRRGY